MSKWYTFFCFCYSFVCRVAVIILLLPTYALSPPSKHLQTPTRIHKHLHTSNNKHPEKKRGIPNLKHPIHFSKPNPLNNPTPGSRFLVPTQKTPSIPLVLSEKRQKMVDSWWRTCERFLGGWAIGSSVSGQGFWNFVCWGKDGGG